MSGFFLAWLIVSLGCLTPVRLIILILSEILLSLKGTGRETGICCPKYPEAVFLCSYQVYNTPLPPFSFLYLSFQLVATAFIFSHNPLTLPSFPFSSMPLTKHGEAFLSTVELPCRCLLYHENPSQLCQSAAQADVRDTCWLHPWPFWRSTFQRQVIHGRRGEMDCDNNKSRHCTRYILNGFALH